MSPPRHHGSVLVGRVTVGIACLLVLGVNGFIYRLAARPPHPELQIAMIITLVWMYTGAFGLCIRKLWGRYLTLSILYTGSFLFFVAGLIIVADSQGPLGYRLKPIIIGVTVYLIMSLVLTHSKHVRRLTSRTWE